MHFRAHPNLSNGIRHLNNQNLKKNTKNKNEMDFIVTSKNRNCSTRGTTFCYFYQYLCQFLSEEGESGIKMKMIMCTV